MHSDNCSKSMSSFKRYSVIYKESGLFRLYIGYMLGPMTLTAKAWNAIQMFNPKFWLVNKGAKRVPTTDGHCECTVYRYLETGC